MSYFAPLQTNRYLHKVQISAGNCIGKQVLSVEVGRGADGGKWLHVGLGSVPQICIFGDFRASKSLIWWLAWPGFESDRREGHKFAWLEFSLTMPNNENSHFFRDVISLRRTSCQV